MAELRLFSRRWHTATDIMPVMSLVIGSFYLIWFLFYFFGTYNLESTGLKYDCDQAYLLRAANYSLFALFFISAVLEFAIVGVGLRGGPLEPGKRRAMTPLLYIKVALWVVFLGATIFGTFVIASPTIADDCWQNNPCITAGGQILDIAACKLTDGSGVPNLTPPCRQVVQSFHQFFVCYSQWLEYGCSWNETKPWDDPSDCQLPGADEPPCFDYDDSADDPSEAIPKNASAQEQAAFLQMLGVSYDPAHVGQSAPWWFCLDSDCGSLLSAADQCNQWDVLLKLDSPDNSSQKAFFEGLIYSSWGMLGITALVVWLAFNSFPDYSDLDSWEGTIKGMANTCCCGSQLEAASAAGGSDPASREIAKSLHVLFGGIDLDPSDRLLGMYLVSEQQCRRRQKQVMDVLSATGIVAVSMKPGLVRRAWHSITKVLRTTGRGSDRKQRQSSVSSTAGAESITAPTSAAESFLRQPPPASGDVVEAAAGQATSLQRTLESLPPLPESVPAAASCQDRIPPPPLAHMVSPFDHHTDSLDVPWGRSLASSLDPPKQHLPPAPRASSGQQRLLSTAGTSQARGLLPMYRHTMMRLRTASLESAAAAALAAHQAQQEAGDGSKETVAQGARLAVAQASPASGTGDLQHQGLEIRLTQRYYPLLTPSGCAKELPITPQQAADIYTGLHEPVPSSVMKKAQRIAKFAIGAYGLQSIIWGKGKRPAMCMGNVNMLVKCLGKPLRIESKFRKRNFNAIMDVTGTNPSDLLYVSYANAPGGVLPYMIILNRQTKSVILAIRGTVSMEDMITDLLSSPLEVDGWLPDWVKEANTSGERMYAHAGIVGSATAILKDLEDRGLLKELLYSQLVKGSDSIAPSNPSGEGGSTHTAWATAKQAGKGLGAKLAFWQAQQVKAGAMMDTLPSECLQPANGSAEEEADAMPNLSSMNANAEVHLPLGRAQSVIRSKLQQEGWQVVVTGHSLGAAVACMLSFHLRDAFPDLKCWAFNPPGGLVSYNLSRIAQRFCTSVVVGKDVISRLSFSTAKRLVDEMVTCLARCKRPKLVVLADLILKRRSRPDSTPLTLCAYEDMSDEAVQALEGYHKTSVLHTSSQVEMYPPGRLVFMRPFKGRKPKQTVWDAVWIDAQALISEGILVSPSMMSHHRIFVVSEAFRSVLAGEVAEAQQGMAEEEWTVLDAV